MRPEIYAPEERLRAEARGPARLRRINSPPVNKPMAGKSFPFVAVALPVLSLSKGCATKVFGVDCTSHSDAASAPTKVHEQSGASPLQANALRPVTDCNCVAERRGGEQQKVNDQSVG